MVLKFTKSRIGNLLLIRGAFLFNVHTENDKKVIWRCVKYKSGCKARVHTTSKKRTGEFQL